MPSAKKKTSTRKTAVPDAGFKTCVWSHDLAEFIDPAEGDLAEVRIHPRLVESLYYAMGWCDHRDAVAILKAFESLSKTLD